MQSFEVLIWRSIECLWPANAATLSGRLWRTFKWDHANDFRKSLFLKSYCAAYRFGIDFSSVEVQSAHRAHDACRTTKLFYLLSSNIRALRFSSLRGTPIVTCRTDPIILWVHCEDRITALLFYPGKATNSSLSVRLNEEVVWWVRLKILKTLLSLTKLSSTLSTFTWKEEWFC